MRFLIYLVLLNSGLLLAENKIALLIGNGNYFKKSLKNPINDIELLEKVFKKIEFKVIKEKNLTKGQMIEVLRQFNSQIDSNTIAIIYFSGHGVHSTLNNQNYLIPIGGFSTLLNESQLPDVAISDSYMLGTMNGAKFSILMLDACRSNDFAEVRGEKGLRQPPQFILNNDYVISYATEVGKTAEDGDINSPYAKALAELLTKPYSIGDIFTKVRAKGSYRRHQKGKQKPLL